MGIVTLLNVFCCIMLVWCMIHVFGRAVRKSYEHGWLDVFLPSLFVAAVCLLCLFFFVYALFRFNYRIVLDKSRRTITSFSLSQCKGATVRLKDYVGFRTATEVTCGPIDGSMCRARQEALYLVDAQLSSHRLMTSLAYRNYEQLKEAIDLPEMTENPIHKR